MLTLRLKPAIEERLERLAARTGRTKTFYASRAIEERLPEFEKTYEALPDADTPAKDAAKVRRAIAALKALRRGVMKPEGMSVNEMKQDGRS
jgi:RHH-type rel operon transcriptional repressor/antitoxin RelB